MEKMVSLKKKLKKQRRMLTHTILSCNYQRQQSIFFYLDKIIKKKFLHFGSTVLVTLPKQNMILNKALPSLKIFIIWHYFKTIQIDGQIDRQIDKQIDRQVDRQTDRQIDRQVGRYTVLYRLSAILASAANFITSSMAFSCPVSFGAATSISSCVGRAQSIWVEGGLNVVFTSPWVGFTPIVSLSW